MHEDSSPFSDLQRIEEWMRIGNRAVRRAQEESRRLGVPNVYGINGRLYYELPNGELSLEYPGTWNPEKVQKDD